MVHSEVYEHIVHILCSSLSFLQCWFYLQIQRQFPSTLVWMQLMVQLLELEQTHIFMRHLECVFDSIILQDIIIIIGKCWRNMWSFILDYSPFIKTKYFSLLPSFIISMFNHFQEDFSNALRLFQNYHKNGKITVKINCLYEIN